MNLIQQYRPNGIAVTDLSAQLWCEKQLEFSLKKGKKETTEMKGGKDRHEELHKEVAELIKVKPKTKEDRVALMLHNSHVGIMRLLEERFTRELIIFGNINSLFVVGSIDELNIEKDKVMLLDTKTRKNDSMPSIAQKRTTEFQLMLYKHLLQSISSKKFTFTDFLDFYNFDSNSRITRDFELQITNLGEKIEPNIKQLAEKTFNLFEMLPEISNDFQIRYEHQKTKKLIGTHIFKFDPLRFQRDCDFIKGFWLGERDAILVGEENRWKCNFCEFKEECLPNIQNV